MRKNSKYIFILILGMSLLFALISLLITSSTVSAETVTVSRVVTQQTISEKTTSYGYYLCTDKGMFIIKPDGFFCCPQFGTFEKDKTYNITCKGIECQCLGIYRYIVWAELVPH